MLPVSLPYIFCGKSSCLSFLSNGRTKNPELEMANGLYFSIQNALYVKLYIPVNFLEGILWMIRMFVYAFLTVFLEEEGKCFATIVYFLSCLYFFLSVISVYGFFQYKSFILYPQRCYSISLGFVTPHKFIIFSCMVVKVFSCFALFF